MLVNSLKLGSDISFNHSQDYLNDEPDETILSGMTHHNEEPPSMEVNGNDISAQQADEEEEVEADVDLETIEGLIEDEDLMSVHDQLNAAQKYVRKYIFVPYLQLFRLRHLMSGEMRLSEDTS